MGTSHSKVHREIPWWMPKFLIERCCQQIHGQDRKPETDYAIHGDRKQESYRDQRDFQQIKHRTKLAKKYEFSQPKRA